MAASYDLTIRGGNTFRRTFRFKGGPPEARTPTDLTGSVLVLTIERRGPSIVRRYDGDATGEITIALTPEETRSLMLGRVGRWSIERRVVGGDEFDLIGGYVIGTNGPGADG